MTFEEWKQKNYKMWNTEQAYMLACEGTPEEENAVDKYSKMIWEAAQKEHEKLLNPVNDWCHDCKSSIAFDCTYCKARRAWTDAQIAIMNDIEKHDKAITNNNHKAEATHDEQGI